MLKGIPPIVSPELLKILMEMGHGDEIVLGDGNFPAASCSKRLIRCDGHGVPEILDAILTLFPLDTAASKPVSLMQTGSEVKEPPTIWDAYQEIIKKHEPEGCPFTYVERYAFYEKARTAYAVIATGESALYANIILKKGVVTEQR